MRMKGQWEMVPWAKELGARPDDLSSLRTHSVEKESRHHKLFGL